MWELNPCHSRDAYCSGEAQREELATCNLLRLPFPPEDFYSALAENIRAEDFAPCRKFCVSFRIVVDFRKHTHFLGICSALRVQ
jgi:hypothetical protein